MKRLGGDIIGQSFAPEVFLARDIGACYAGIYLVVNYAEGVVRDWEHDELKAVFFDESEAMSRMRARRRGRHRPRGAVPVRRVPQAHAAQARRGGRARPSGAASAADAPHDAMIVTADWVLPVCDPPIRDGAVAVSRGRHRRGRDRSPTSAPAGWTTPTSSSSTAASSPPASSTRTRTSSLTVLEGLAPPAPLPEWLRRRDAARSLGLSHEEFGGVGRPRRARLPAGRARPSSATSCTAPRAARAATALGLGGRLLLGGARHRRRPRWRSRWTGAASRRRRRARRRRRGAARSPASRPTRPTRAGPGLLRAAHRIRARVTALPCVDPRRRIGRTRSTRSATGPARWPRPCRPARPRLRARRARPRSATSTASACSTTPSACTRCTSTDDDIGAARRQGARRRPLPALERVARQRRAARPQLRAAGVRLALGHRLARPATTTSTSSPRSRALRALDPTLTARRGAVDDDAGGAQLLGLAGVVRCARRRACRPTSSRSVRTPATTPSRRSSPRGRRR